MRSGRDLMLEKEEKDKTKALFTVTYFNHNPFSRVICFMKDIGIIGNCTVTIVSSQLYLCNQDTFLSFTWTIWSAILRKRFSNPRNHLGVQCVGLHQQLRHQQALTPCHPFLLMLLMTRMGLQAHKMRVASVWVFSFAFCIFYCWLRIVIEQTAHNLGVSTSVSALEISRDLPPVSVPAAGPNLVHTS